MKFIGLEYVTVDVKIIRTQNGPVSSQTNYRGRILETLDAGYSNIARK